MAIVDRLSDWLDERTGWRASARAWVDHPFVGGGAWAGAMATAVAACFGVLALSGVVLMTAYAPAPQSAWASVHYVQYVQDRGWIVRGLHYWAAQALLVLAAMHVAHAALSASYRKPREIVWWLTLAVPAVALAECITGGLLPWDQRGWWARVVEGNIVGLAPAVGPWIQRMIQGGSELGALGLARAYTAHVVLLPGLIACILLARRRLAARYGAGASGGAQLGARLLARHAWVAAATVFAVFALTGAMRGAPLDAPADPMSDYPARPEWFLLPLFELRKFFHGPGEFWGTTLLPGAALAVLAALPFVDRPPRSRAWAVLPALAIFAGGGALAAMAWRTDARDPQYAKQRAKADALAAAATQLALQGVPPAGALQMVRQDPELRGRDLFDKHCASCHVLGGAGDPAKATATKLDGWTTPKWIASMIHDPDAAEFFGRGPYKGDMPSVDVRPKEKPAGEPWTPMVKGDAEMQAVATFLAAQGDEPGDPPRPVSEAVRAQGEKIVSERCTTCHLFKGDGDDEGSQLAPELGRYGSVAWTRAQVANPASPATYRDRALDANRKKHMPRFDADLSPADVDVVARWTRAHARGVPVR
jgi:ubiquinol-cytochrome c reductase cytochrome b subunit